MTAKEFVCHLAPVELERLASIFNFLAEHEHELQLASGQPLNDGLDFAAFLREVAAALQFPDRGKVTERQPQARWDRTCPDCDHEHEGKTECSHYLGEGKFCRCESKVTA